MKLAELSIGLDSPRLDLPELQVFPDHLGHFASAIQEVPICNFRDLKETGQYSLNPAKFEETYKKEEGVKPGTAYAWKRLPRFLDDFKRIRTTLQQTHQGELIMGLDLGSSFPIYSELMRSVNLRKAGDYAERAVASSLGKLAEEREELDFGRPGVVFLEVHARHSSELRTALVSGF